jgi:hypothetical protein
MKKPILLILVFGLAFPSFAQSATELSAKYPVVTSYEVRPGILMTARFTAEGQACKMSFAIQHNQKHRLYLDSLMSEKMATDIADELVPPSVRGKELNEPFQPSGLTVVAGQAVMKFYKYENVVMEFAWNFRQDRPGVVAVDISWKNRTCKD